MNIEKYKTAPKKSSQRSKKKKNNSRNHNTATRSAIINIENKSRNIRAYLYI